MSNFEEKDALTNAAFDKFVEERKLMIGDEATRELMFDMFLGGMQFMLDQFLPYIEKVEADIK